MSLFRLLARTGLAFLLFAPATHLMAQAPPPTDPKAACAADEKSSACLSSLLAAIQQLQQRVHEMEDKQAAATAAPAAQAAVDSPMPDMPMPTESVGTPKLQIHGFSHVTASTIDHQATVIPPPTGQLISNRTTFTLGNVDLYITSKLSEKWSMLAEVNFEADDTNNFAIDMERLLVQYKPSDLLQLSVGRFHTEYGYYNTAFHHGSWFETAISRPLLFQFEDSGGILPAHNVGVSAIGLVPSGGWGLHYIAEVGNGVPHDGTVQSHLDNNNGKATNLGFYIKPQWASGLRAGFAWYQEHVTTPSLAASVKENDFIAHVVYITPKFEFLNEGALVRHKDDLTGHIYNTPGFYTQISRAWGKYRPYFRYQYINSPTHEPLNNGINLYAGPSAGLRIDVSDFVALKVQYDHTTRRSLPSTNTLATQISFTF